MIKEQLQKDQIEAMKSKNQEKLQTLRFILAQIKNIEIDKGAELTDEETIQVLRKESKKLQDAIDTFKTQNRDDLANEYSQQKDVLQAYLPQEMSEEELKAEIQTIINQNEALFRQNPNALIGICIKQLKERADSARIAAAVKSFQ